MLSAEQSKKISRDVFQINLSLLSNLLIKSILFISPEKVFNYVSTISIS